MARRQVLSLDLFIPVCWRQPLGAILDSVHPHPLLPAVSLPSQPRIQPLSIELVPPAATLAHALSSGLAPTPVAPLLPKTTFTECLPSKDSRAQPQFLTPLARLHTNSWLLYL
ncbi:hypothetical protein P7K49_012244 [Saguinus oedipus]|uniref:Uncharacterized protein n=1 Tax=Saguinus oedipus TaxID=9490 RepID=A0ABQ9VT75_SAGOE|nr:hypothetical protein P7K49_012244 [Saguinus oedipus]